MKTSVSADLHPVLVGPTLRLRPLQVEDYQALYVAASDPLIWEQNPEPTRYQKPVFEKLFAKYLELSGPLVIIDKHSGEIIGTSSYYDYDPEKQEIAIGYTFITRRCWGGRTNAELKQLMLRHIFQWVNVVWFHIGASNWRSRKALEKLGGVLSHAGQRPTASGGMTDYLYYKITAPEAN